MEFISGRRARAFTGDRKESAGSPGDPCLATDSQERKDGSPRGQRTDPRHTPRGSSSPAPNSALSNAQGQQTSRHCARTDNYIQHLSYVRISVCSDKKGGLKRVSFTDLRTTPAVVRPTPSPRVAAGE